MPLPSGLQDTDDEEFRAQLIRFANKLERMIDGGSNDLNTAVSDDETKWMLQRLGAVTPQGSVDASALLSVLNLGTMANQNADDVNITGGTIAASTITGLGSMASQAASSVSITGGSITGITDLAIADGGTGASVASAARSNLGLGDMATQAASNVSITGGSLLGITSFSCISATITGGSITGITDLAVADGGTGASDASGARINLGIGKRCLYQVYLPASGRSYTSCSYKQYYYLNISAVSDNIGITVTTVGTAGIGLQLPTGVYSYEFLLNPSFLNSEIRELFFVYNIEIDGIPNAGAQFQAHLGLTYGTYVQKISAAIFGIFSVSSESTLYIKETAAYADGTTLSFNGVLVGLNHKSVALNTQGTLLIQQL